MHVRILRSSLVDSVFFSETKHSVSCPHYLRCFNDALNPKPSFAEGIVANNSHLCFNLIIPDRVIPPNTSIFTSVYTLQRDPRYFSPYPDDFLPERWLNNLPEGKTEEYELSSAPFTHDLAAFIPFSFGPASCLGKELAYKEMRLTIATLVRKYDFRFADGYDPDRYIRELKDNVGLMKGEFPVILTKRRSRI